MLSLIKKKDTLTPNYDVKIEYDPSKKSKKAASIIIKTASFQLAWIENFIEEIPAMSDINVIKLGMNLVRGCSAI